MQRISFVAAAAAFALATGADAANLVLNGDFTQLPQGPGYIDSNTSLPDWSSTGYNWVNRPTDDGDGLNLWQASNAYGNPWNGETASGIGNLVALHGGSYNTGPLTQLIMNLAYGVHYTLSFDYAFAQGAGYDGASVQSLDVTIGSTSWNSGDVHVASHGFSGWRHGELGFFAPQDGTTDALSFMAHGDTVAPFALVAAVGIPGVPEPRAWSLMIAGLGAVGAGARRRRTAVVGS